ncbi:hypothetical protein CYY_002721 [Polysphondylium violaceum]|uniref:N-alpha-acetyltransferase 30 n=1 Tax=Polysphondylium violaceum TaxID=133409 RepID=A0A8J4PYV4_9MYCE|nr:hypothetical protein CYY_002721 [Polysphondylium violaceum]
MTDIQNDSHASNESSIDTASASITTSNTNNTNSTYKLSSFEGDIVEFTSEQLNSSQGVLVGDIQYIGYQGETQIEALMNLIKKELPEPYTIFTYRYFLNKWPELCFLAYDKDQLIGVVISKKQPHGLLERGYIGMLVVDKEYRRKKIGSNLVKLTLDKMIKMDCDEIVLETIISNSKAIALYENLGFIRVKRLYRYYAMGADAIRLLLPIKDKFIPK